MPFHVPVFFIPVSTSTWSVMLPFRHSMFDCDFRFIILQEASRFSKSEVKTETKFTFMKIRDTYLQRQTKLVHYER